MSYKYRKYLLLPLFVMLSAHVTNAQSFGFGCLGLSGFYGGYTQQYYKADGINDFVMQNYNGPRSTPGVEFKMGTGYRIGANLFRADFEDVFLTVKGYYQFLKEEHDVVDNLGQGKIQNNYELSMNYWGVGMDFGFPLFSVVDLKLIEGGVTFYNVDFTHSNSLNNALQFDTKISPDKVQIGYYIGSGLIIHLIRDYISIEGTAVYTLLQIDKMGSGGNIIPPA